MGRPAPEPHRSPVTSDHGNSMPLVNPSIPYAIAVATPRDTRADGPHAGAGAAFESTAFGDRYPDAPMQIERAWSEPQRRDWLASRLAAKRAASALLARSGRRPKRIEIVRGGAEGRAGQGVVAEQVAALTPTRFLRVPLSLSISLSHTDGHAIAAAAAHPARIGVDLEREGQISSVQARYFLSARERRMRGARTLTELWALKEAAWKALGCGDSTPFSDLELILDDGGAMRAVRLGTMVFPAIAEIRHPWPGWVAAVLVLQGIAA